MRFLTGSLELGFHRPLGLPLVLNMLFKVATLVCLLANSMTCDEAGDDDDDDDGYG